MPRGSLTGRVPAALLVAFALVLSDPTAAAAIQIRSNGSRTERVVALTIDDGWNAKACRAIFEILERRHIPRRGSPSARR